MTRFLPLPFLLLFAACAVARDVPYVPTPDKVVERMLEVARRLQLRHTAVPDDWPIAVAPSIIADSKGSRGSDFSSVRTTF